MAFQELQSCFYSSRSAHLAEVGAGRGVGWSEVFVYCEGMVSELGRPVAPLRSPWLLQPHLQHLEQELQVSKT